MAKTALSTIGIVIKINNKPVWGATEFGDLGGEPNMIDATKLTDSVRVNIIGIQEQDAWQVTYQYDSGDTENDYTWLKALDRAKTKNVPVSVEFPDGSVFNNSGQVSTYIQGKGIGEVITAVASVSLDGEWTEGTTTP